ncbi:MAG: hypothetical protein H7210_12395 [Pyrinomonadaceae bacterium]|nr:hypothetical protein [Phycisphaerales bacterium]
MAKVTRWLSKLGWMRGIAITAVFVVTIAWLVSYKVTLIWYGWNGKAVGISCGEIGVAWRNANRDYSKDPAWMSGIYVERRVGRAWSLLDWFKFNGWYALRNERMSLEWIVAICWAILVFWIARRHRLQRAVPMECECGYSLIGLKELGKCPECGRSYSLSVLGSTEK